MRAILPLGLILVGIGLSAIAGAATTIMITFGEITQVTRALVWLVGSVYARGWSELWAVLPWLLVLVPLALLSAPTLRVASAWRSTGSAACCC